MQIARTIDSVRKAVKKARNEGKTIALVPTMGALHQGHISLIKAATQAFDFVVVSIFVNPAQFGPGEDLDKYPRDLEVDSEICENAGVQLIFAPENNQMYPDKNLTWVTVDKLSENLCGRFRPGHFRAVATVCAKLFNIICPDTAFFGQKDAQQAILIKRMVKDLNLDLEIVICPTVREDSGLALSSRNKYLSSEEKKDARLLYSSLKISEKMIHEGVCDCQKLIQAIRQELAKSKKIQIEYVSITDTQKLQNIERIDRSALVSLAVKIGTARLIDNILLDLKK